MDFKTYLKYLRFAWDEELQRVEEWVSARLNGDDWAEGGDSYWIGLDVGEIGCPSLEALSTALKGRDVAADFAVVDGGDREAKERLYLDLRDLL